MTKLTPQKLQERQDFIKELVKVIEELRLQGATLEGIGRVVDKQFGTVQRWSKGRGKCSKGDLMLLKRELAGYEGQDKFEEGGENV